MINEKISLRKIILLSLIAFLVIVLICQVAIKGANHSYKLTLKGEIDQISIENENGNINLNFKDEKWFIDENQEADLSSINIMTDFLKSIPVLGTVSHNSDVERYGLDNSIIKVQVKRKGKIVRSLEIGKNSVTNQQVYCRLDGKKEVVLVGSNPRNIFTCTKEELSKKSE